MKHNRVTTVALLGTLAWLWAVTAAPTGAQETTRATDEDLARRVAALRGWPSRGDTARYDWQPMIEVARDLQAVDAERAKAILRRSLQKPLNGRGSSVMLLLRVMFELPKTRRPQVGSLRADGVGSKGRRPASA